MKASEVIAALQKQIEEHGDLEAGFPDWANGGVEDIQWVGLSQNYARNGVARPRIIVGDSPGAATCYE